jgi:hypothetical protein
MRPSPSASGALLGLLGALAAGPATGEQAPDAGRILRAAYPGYDPVTEALPEPWKTAPAPAVGLEATAAATHVVIRIEETRPWGSSELLALTTLAYRIQRPDGGMERQVLLGKRAELLLLRGGSFELVSRAGLGDLHADVQGESGLHFDKARFDLTESERAIAVRISESEAVVGIRAVTSRIERLALFRIGGGRLQEVFRREMYQESGTGACYEETEEEARDRCGCSLDEAECMAETAEIEQWVLIVSASKTGGFFDLTLKGTEESRVGGKLEAPARRRVETWRWDGARYVKQAP